MRNLLGFTIDETAYHPNQKLSDHQHKDARLIVLVKGGFTEKRRRREISFSRPAAIFRRSQEIHSNTFHNLGARCLNISLREPYLEHLRNFGVSLESIVELNGDDEVFLIAKLYDEFHRKDKISSLVIEGLLLEMLTKAARSKPALLLKDRKPPHWLEQAREYIHAQFASTLSLSTIAQHAGIHSVHLARSFRKYYGLTVGDYIRRLRIRAACLEISGSNTPLAEIALNAGFCDQTHFTKTFKREMRILPTEYRRLFDRRYYDTKKLI